MSESHADDGKNAEGDGDIRLENLPVMPPLWRVLVFTRVGQIFLALSVLYSLATASVFLLISHATSPLFGISGCLLYGMAVSVAVYIRARSPQMRSGGTFLYGVLPTLTTLLAIALQTLL